MNALTKFAAVAAVALTIPAAVQAQTKEINFGVISTESSQNLKTVWGPFLSDMEKQTGLKVNAFFVSDYAGVIEGMRFGKVQVAWFGNKSGMEAVDRAGGEVFAQTVDGEGNPGYWSILITQAGNDKINSLDDVLKCDKSLNFSIGDPNSTSGFLVPTTFIFAQKGVNPKECFKTIRNANHETNLLAVANNQVDVATNNTENYRRLQVTNPDAVKKIKEIWRSPLIPSDPLVWRKDLEPALKDKIYTFIMTYGRLGSPDEVKKQRAILSALQWAPFKPSSDAQLYPIRVLQFSKDMAKIENDDKLSAADKADKLKALRVEKAKYEKLMGEVPQS